MDACASNMGHCLWFGLVDEDKAPLVAEKLMSAQMFSGWGVRTLATDMGAYNPASYQNGPVWPHDNATIAAGLVRYGFVEEAQRIATALLEAAQFSDGRLPELFCSFDRERFGQSVPYPTACPPQAWACGWTRYCRRPTATCTSQMPPWPAAGLSSTFPIPPPPSKGCPRAWC